MAGRIAFVGVICAAGVLLAALGLSVVGRAQERSEHVHQGFVFLRGPDGEWQRAHVMYPRRPDGESAPPGERYPLVIALHGRGETRKRPDRAAIAWSVDYHLADAFGALARGRLERVDLRTFTSDRHLGLLNRELAVRPFQGVLVVTPPVPDLMAEESTEADLSQYAEWLAGPLLSAVRDEYPQAARGRAATAIDGVSMGGWVALEAGFRHPDRFGAVGGIQPAIGDRVEDLAEAARQAGISSSAQRVRLLSSEDDPFLGVTRDFSQALRRRRVPHTLTVVPGPHGYEFNRGPAAVELLRFADSALAREVAP